MQLEQQQKQIQQLQKEIQQLAEARAKQEEEHAAQATAREGQEVDQPLRNKRPRTYGEAARGPPSQQGATHRLRRDVQGRATTAGVVAAAAAATRLLRAGLQRAAAGEAQEPETTQR